MIDENDDDSLAHHQNKLFKLARLRLRDFSYCAQNLSKQERGYSRKASLIRVLTIILGALVASKGIADQLMVDFKSPTMHMVGLILYTIIGIVISAAAGLEGAFQFTKKSAEVNMLASQAYSGSRRYMGLVDIHMFSDDPGGSIPVLIKTVEAQDAELEEIYKKAAELGINLTSTSTIRYAEDE